MAETAATASGIAGLVGVLQSLLQCYKEFLTARDFVDDFAVCQLRAALLENSTITWAIAVGLQNENGEPRNEFLVHQPTDSRAKLVKAALELTRKQLDIANKEVDAYTTEEKFDGEEESGEHSSASEVDERPSKMRRMAMKLHRTVHRQHDAEHPGTMKRTTWALIDKGRLEATLDKVTTLVDRLNTDFAPVDQKQQLEQYCGAVKKFQLSDQELTDIGAAVGDQVFKTVVKMLQHERATGDRFVGMKVTKEGTVNIGDYYDKEWKGSSQRLPSKNDTYEKMSVTDTAFVNIGDNFGGKNPIQMRFEQQEVARKHADNRGAGDD